MKNFLIKIHLGVIKVVAIINKFQNIYIIYDYLCINCYKKLINLYLLFNAYFIYYISNQINFQYFSLYLIFNK